jgi:hypothetical protein
MEDPMRTGFAVLFLLAVILAGAPPAAHAAGNDLCVTFDGGCCGEGLVGKDFGVLPARNKCKPIHGFHQPFFGVANGMACRSADGDTLYVQWVHSNASLSGIAMWHATLPVPIPSTGIGSLLSWTHGQEPNGQTNVPFSVTYCEVPVPN